MVVINGMGQWIKQDMLLTLGWLGAAFLAAAVDFLVAGAMDNVFQKDEGKRNVSGKKSGPKGWLQKCRLIWPLSRSMVQSNFEKI